MGEMKRRESRVAHFEHELKTLQFFMAKRALELVKLEMCTAKGFERHNGANYYTHLVDVAQRLLNAGVRNENYITAALLHDIVEDVQGYTIQSLRDMFNEAVASMVDLVTKKEGINYKKPENIKAYLNDIRGVKVFEVKDESEILNIEGRILYIVHHKDFIEVEVENFIYSEDIHIGACLIKAADRMHNFGSLRDATPEKKLRQAEETEKYFIPFFKYCRKQFAWYATFFFEAKTQIEPHLWEIRERYEEDQKKSKKIIELSRTISEKDQLILEQERRIRELEDRFGKHLEKEK